MKKSLERDLNNLRKQLDFDVDEELEFPVHGDEEINRLIEELQKLKKPLKNLKVNYDEDKSFYEKERTTYEIEENRFYSKYEKIISFSMSLEQVKGILKEEQEAIIKKKKYLFQQQELVEKEGKSINNSIDKLQKYNIKHSYLVTMVQELKQIPKKTKIKIEDDFIPRNTKLFSREENTNNFKP